MYLRTRTGVAFLSLGLGVVGCGGVQTLSPSSIPLGGSSAPLPSTPAASAPPAAAATSSAPATLVVFREPATGFSTTDLYDAHGRIFQVNTAGDLIVTADGTHVPGYEVTGTEGPPTYYIGPKSHICAEFCVFSVRFGGSPGGRRAYLTIDYGHSNPGTLVDVEERDGTLIVTQTASYPPGTPTLFGRVTEMTAAGEVPVAGAGVYRSVPGGWQDGVTDENGIYKISGLLDGANTVSVLKGGYARHEVKEVVIQGDTRYDVVLVRQ